MPLARSRHPAILAALAALLLGGCGDGTAAGPSPLPTVSPAPTVGAFTKSPEPEPARETAKDFIRRWPLVETAMVTTGDSTEFLSLSDDNCKYCSNLAARITDMYANGGFVKTSGWRVGKIRKARGSEPGEHKYEISCRYEPSKLKETAQGRVQQLNGGVVTQEVTLMKTVTGWLMGESVEMSDGS